METVNASGSHTVVCDALTRCIAAQVSSSRALSQLLMLYIEENIPLVGYLYSYLLPTT